MKKISKQTVCFIASMCIVVSAMAQKQFKLKSPNGKIEMSVSVDKIVDYTVSHLGDVVIDRSPISMTITGGQSFGIDPKLSGSEMTSVNQIITPAVYKKAKIKDVYNQLTVRFKGDYAIVFRAYDDGIAYRFLSTAKKPFVVENEQATFNFPGDGKAYIPYVRNGYENGSFDKQFYNSFENTYIHDYISKWDKRRLAFSPLIVESTKGLKLCILEADLLNYPGMYLHSDGSTNSLKGVFAPYPKDIKQGGHNMLQGVVQSRESYIAKYDGATNFPWRAVVISENDAELANNDMVYKLASPTQLTDYSWIKPGKVAWDWWNDWNLYGVDFKAGINNKTYKYYIDFAAAKGISYVILDEGWAVNLKADLLQVVPEIDLKELTDYAKQKGVGLILWAGYYAFDRDMEAVCKQYAAMGIKGFKVDFMDRDDQPMVDFHHRAAQMAAKYQLMLDFHGTYKPSGLQRTYPNVINFEGVYGLEQLKWEGTSHDQVTYDVTIPFIRMVAGPLDYTQGAMRNATKENYRPVNSEAMSQGTRCRQLAEYVVFESPLNMMCDSPSNYLLEAECTNFIAAVPTVWDNTIAMDGKIGEYVAIARQKGDTWYVGAMTNWDARKLELDMSFLGEGTFEAEMFKDGINADRAARDYVKQVVGIPTNKKLSISMAPGGGCVMVIRKKA